MKNGGLLAAVLLAGVAAVPAGVRTAAEQEAIKLEPPRMAGGMRLMEALKNRKTIRSLSDQGITRLQLSELLWAANGVNRKDGKRTSPAAMNKQEIGIYAVLPEGIYLYDAAGNVLVPVAAGDFRRDTGKQDFVFTAPVNLVFVMDYGKFNGSDAKVDERAVRWACIAAGSMTQNVALYCASEGLGNVVRGWVDEEAFMKAAKLGPDKVFLIAQTVGRPK